MIRANPIGIGAVLREERDHWPRLVAVPHAPCNGFSRYVLSTVNLLLPRRCMRVCMSVGEKRFTGRAVRPRGGVDRVKIRILISPALMLTLNNRKSGHDFSGSLGIYTLIIINNFFRFCSSFFFFFPTAETEIISRMTTLERLFLFFFSAETSRRRIEYEGKETRTRFVAFLSAASTRTCATRFHFYTLSVLPIISSAFLLTPRSSG